MLFSTPTLNDVCIAEADKTMAKVARIDPVIAQALKDKRLFVLVWERHAQERER